MKTRVCEGGPPTCTVSKMNSLGEFEVYTEPEGAQPLPWEVILLPRLHNISHKTYAWTLHTSLAKFRGALHRLDGLAVFDQQYPLSCNILWYSNCGVRPLNFRL